MNKYAQAPIPFVGQKRMFLSHFRALLEHIPGDGEDWTIVDAFGGSGLLSRTAKDAKPGARVIYNDHDFYASRLRHIPDTNRLRRRLAETLADSPRNKKIDKSDREKVRHDIETFDGFVDVQSLCAWLLFSGKQAGSLAEMARMTWYHTVRKSDFALAEDYLDGLEVTHCDFAALLDTHADDRQAVFILDPPYICSQQGAYAQTAYFGMVEFLRLMRLVRPPFIFFGSTRSELVAYLDFVIDERWYGWERVRDYKRIIVRRAVSYAARYEDNIIYRF